MAGYKLTRSQAGRVLEDWLEQPAACTGIRKLHGGMINTVLRLEFDRPPFAAVIKFNTGDADFPRKAQGLDYLHA